MRRVVFILLISLSNIGWSERIPKTYLQALDAISQKQYTQAQQLLLAVIQDPNTPREYQARSYNYLGDIALVNQSYQTAQVHYRKVLESYNDTSIYPRALYNMARMYIILGDNDAGIALLSDYLHRYATEDVNEDGALYWLGRAFSSKGEYYRTLGLYRELLSRFPSSVYAYHTRQFIQTLEASLRTSSSKENDPKQIAEEQTRYLKMLSRLLDLQNQLLDIKKQHIEELKQMLAQEGL